MPDPDRLAEESTPARNVASFVERMRAVLERHGVDVDEAPELAAPRPLVDLRREIRLELDWLVEELRNRDTVLGAGVAAADVAELARAWRALGGQPDEEEPPPPPPIDGDELTQFVHARLFNARGLPAATAAADVASTAIRDYLAGER